MSLPAGVVSKVERAGEHLDALDGAIKRHNTSKPYRIVEERDPQSGIYNFLLKLDRPLPGILPILIGEIVYQLRSALDHIVWALSQPDPPARCEFPVYKDWGPFVREGMNKLSKLPTAARDEIVGLQPYRRGKSAQTEPLWIVHELRRVDMHRSINVVYHWGTVPIYFYEVYEGVVNDGKVLFRAPPDFHDRQYVKPIVTLEIMVDVSGARIDLRRFRRVCELIRDHVIPRFERFFE